MKKHFTILMILIPFLLIGNEKNVMFLSQQAEALSEAHDDAGASQIYEQLLSQSLPLWQQTRIFYNLGTLRLAQHRPIEALSFFQKISAHDLSLPQFGRDLFLNIGIAYFQYAEMLALTSSSSFDQQVIFLEQSLEAFDQAQTLNCQIQKKEQENTSFSCYPYLLLDQWIPVVRLQLYTVHQQKCQQWIQQANIESLASFLHQDLQEWLDRLKTLQVRENNSTQNSSEISYFQHQGESLISIWNALQHKEFSVNQQKVFDRSKALYLNGLHSLNQQDLPSAIQAIQESIEALNPLNFQKNIPFQQARLRYEILLLQDRLILSAVEDLFTQFDSLKVEKEQTASLEMIKKNLKKSIEELKADHQARARFFFIAGFSPVNSLFNTEDKTPVPLLQQALEQAKRALQLLVLSTKISKQIKTNELLKNQQHDILVQAAPFIPAVLNEQNIHFYQEKNSHSHCQQSPWDQVIPLYDRGYQAAQIAEKRFNYTSWNSQEIMSDQEETIEAWQQALNLLLHPPQQNNNKTSSSQNLTETFRLIQEMYLEDQAQSEQKSEELHSW